MTSRILGSFIIGFIFVSILDFLYFIGLKLNYFDFYDINIYFNVLFFDNQNFYILPFVTLIVGYLSMYSKFTKFFMKVYIGVIVLSGVTLYAPVGKYLGELLFLKKNQSYKLGSTAFHGATLYEGRENIYIYRDKLSKTIKLLKKDVVITSN